MGFCWKNARRVTGWSCVPVVALALAAGATAWGQATGRTVFVANHGNLEGSVTALKVNADDTLTVLNRIITGTRPNTQVPCPGCNPYEISLSPSGKWLATGHATGEFGDEQITIFEVAPDGTISQYAAFTVPQNPMDVTWLSDELLAVIRTGTRQVALMRFQPGSPPTLTDVDVENVGVFSTYLVAHPSRRFLYVNDSGSQYKIFAFRVEAGGALVLIDTEYTGSYFPLDLAISPDGTKLYAAGGITNVQLGFAIDADGLLSPLAGSPFPEAGSSPSNVAVSSDSKYLLVGHGTDATVRSFSIDPPTGNLTYTGAVFDVGLQGTLGDVQVMGDLFFVTDNSTAIDGKMGIYSFTLNPDGTFTMNGPDLVSTGGIAPKAIATWLPAGKKGDLNCDTKVDFFDINPFVLALSDPAGYAAAYPNCPITNGDVNGDGKVDFFDINPFVGLLTGE